MVIYCTCCRSCALLRSRLRVRATQQPLGELPSEHLSSHSQVKRLAKRHCPSVKQRAVGNERCLLDSPESNRCCASPSERLTNKKIISPHETLLSVFDVTPPADDRSVIEMCHLRPTEEYTRLK